MYRKTIAASGFLLIALTGSALACLWDTDTLQMERLRFPGVLEIITGKFVRHSQPYYEWRIIDRQKKLEAKPGDPALIDDLAVAYAKLGRPEEGIPLLEQSLATQPDRYETLSNLGTLLFFAGRLDESKRYIRRALEIDPNAHFGRERYQLLLTEYLQKSDWGTAGVMCFEPRGANEGVVGFARYVVAEKFGDEMRIGAVAMLDDDNWSRVRIDELMKAKQGVLGMLHFANHQSPLLLEALGDLLVSGPIEKNASQLAARAYLRASQVIETENTPASLRKMANEALLTHKEFEEIGEERALSRLQDSLRRELAAADAWFDTIRVDEQKWIAENRDVDQAFAAKYYDSLDQTIATAERQVKSEPTDRRLSMRQHHNRLIFATVSLILGIPTLVLAAIVAGIWRYRSARQNGARIST